MNTIWTDKIRFKDIRKPMFYMGAKVKGAYYDDEQMVGYMPHNYLEDYFTIKSLDDNNTITLSKVSSSYNPAFYYSLDNGESWISNNAQTSITINNGDTIKFKATPSYSFNWSFTSTGRYNVYGNSMSLLYGDDFVSKTELKTGDDILKHLFYNSTYLVDAGKLMLPATTARSHCYEGMFEGCTSLVAAPALPATTIKVQCYRDMFKGCTSLVTAPELPALSASENGTYYQMFYGCSSLNYVKCMLKNSSYGFGGNNWLYGVAGTGTFVKNKETKGWETGASGIPEGWTVIDA